MSSSDETIGLLIKKAQHRHHWGLEARLAPLGVSLVQWNALREIHRNPGCSMHRLAELTFNSDQAFGTLTTRLLRLGFVERQQGIGRANIHCLTAKGEKLLHECQAIVLDFLAMSFAPLTEDERSTLGGLLARLLGEDRPS